MVERLKAECICCMLKRHLDRIVREVEHDNILEYSQKVLKIMAEAKPIEAAPQVMEKVYALQREILGINQDYNEIKKYFNGLILSREDNIISIIEKHSEPLKLAIKYAMIGNYIDFGAVSNVNEEELDKMLNNAYCEDVDNEEYSALINELKNAKRLVYLTDNCGEIVFDKILIKFLKRFYPELNINVIVRGGDVLNDATMEDARQVELDKIVDVIHNGNNVAGTCLDRISKQAEEMINNADVIIAKGQANYETLRMCGKNIYYIFLCKCDMFAKHFNVPKFTGILVNDKNVEEI